MNSLSLGWLHMTFALVALLLGVLVLVRRKGTSTHRIAGYGYVSSMLALNASALSLYHLTGHFGPFHVLALVSLSTVLIGGLAPGLRRRGWLAIHYRSMAWSYIGLVAAACAEAMVRIPIFGIHTAAGAIAVGVAIALVSSIFGILLIPRLQRAALKLQSS
jgi:uncharacterized membrane protein